MIKFRLTEVLKEKGKSQYWLAKEMGMDESQLYRIRKSKGIQWATLDRICEALSCEPTDLIVRVEDEQEGRVKKKSKR